jgi:hypothetical protein
MTAVSSLAVAKIICTSIEFICCFVLNYKHGLCFNLWGRTMATSCFCSCQLTLAKTSNKNQAIIFIYLYRYPLPIAPFGLILLRRGESNSRPLDYESSALPLRHATVYVVSMFIILSMYYFATAFSQCNAVLRPCLPQLFERAFCFLIT